jgi:hypothetical protein
MLGVLGLEFGVELKIKDEREKIKGRDAIYRV